MTKLDSGCSTRHTCDCILSATGTCGLPGQLQRLRHSKYDQLLRDVENCHLKGKCCHRWSDAMKITKRRVGFLTVSPFEQLNLVGPSAVFSEPQVAGSPAYQVHLLSASKEITVRSHGGLTIGPATHYSRFEEPLDTLLVIGGEGAMGRPEAGLINWLSERSKRTRRIGLWCTGACA